MIPISLFPRQVQIYFILFASTVTAAPRNVTVDDAVLTGVVVPQYLPSASSWNQGNDCSGCFAKPDPSLTYNGTWHDATFNPTSGVYQEIEFTFVGTALYIFFILANTVPRATTLTDIVFYLDGSPVATFVHTPSTSTDYQYNVPVYVNQSLPLSEHSMMIKPVNSGNSVLMLFDYLVYTTTSSSVSSSGTAQNTAAIVGGTLGGVAAVFLAIASLLCYRRHKKYKPIRLRASQKDVVLGSLVSLDTTAARPIPCEHTGFYFTESRPDKCQPTHARSPATLRSPSPPISINPPSTAYALGNNAAVLEQVELLKEEVSHLRRLQALRMKANSGQNS